MIDRFAFVARRTEDIVIVRYCGPSEVRPTNRQTIWTKTKSRQVRSCAALEDEIIREGDWCWSPMTNAVYRGRRISERGMAHLEATMRV